MYAAIRQYEMGAGSARDLMPIIDNELAEVMSGMAGFVSYHVIASGDDEIVAVTLFGEEQDAVRSNEVAADFVRERLQRVPAQPHLCDERRGRRRPHGSERVRGALAVLSAPDQGEDTL